MWSNKDQTKTTMVSDNAENALLLCREEFERKLSVIISKDCISKDIIKLFNPSHIVFFLGGVNDYAQATNRIKLNNFIQFDNNTKLYRLDSTKE
jgi:hypothetical protein